MPLLIISCKIRDPLLEGEERSLIIEIVRGAGGGEPRRHCERRRWRRSLERDQILSERPRRGNSGMPRVGLPGRLLRTRSSPLSAESCSSCASAATSSSSTSNSRLNPPPTSLFPSPTSPFSSSASPCPLSPSWLNSSPAPLFGRSIYSSSTPSRQEEEEERFGKLFLISRPSRGAPNDVGIAVNDLIVGVKGQREQQQQVGFLGRRLSPRAPQSLVLQSIAVSYSTDTSESSERDLHVDQEEQQPEISQSVSPRLEKRQEEQAKEEEVADREGFYNRHDSTAVAPAGDIRRSATFLRGEGEVTTQVYSALSSTDEEEESDLSELEVVDVEVEGGDTQRANSRLEYVLQEAAAEREEVDSSERFSDFVNGVSTTVEAAADMGLESEPDRDQHQDGRPYLHTLSVDEIRKILEKARAKDVRILQVRKSCEWVDQLVFASGRSSRHLRGMADAIVYKVKQLSANVGPNSFPIVEGRDGEQWMAVDCGNVVVHLFLEEARSYYNLEEFWTKKSNPRLVETY